MKRLAKPLSCAPLCLSLVWNIAQGDTPSEDTPVLEEVRVTAQKRSERLEDVPITIAAFDASQLENSGITTVNDLGVVIPGLVYTDVTGYGLPYLRGIGTTATGPGFENPVATYVDGVYYASQGAAVLSFNDIESIEVDKGPQGTLFGRNTTGGAIQINTLAPSQQFGGTAEVGYGNYAASVARLYVTGGLTDHLAANFAFNYSDQGDGYGKNLANGKDVDKSDNLGFRSKFRYTSDDGTRITLSVDYTRSTSIPTLAPAPGTVPEFAPPVASNPRDVYGDPQPWNRTTQYGGSIAIIHDLPWATLTSTTAFRTTFADALFDSTLTAVPGTRFFIVGNEPHRQASEELQFASSTGGAFDWVSGAFLYWERAGYLDPTLLGGDSFAAFGLPGGIIQAPDDKTYSAALYGQGTYHFDSATSVTGGLRFTDEYKQDEFYQDIASIDEITDLNSHHNFTNVSWRLALQHAFRQGMMGYLAYNRGYKSGGFNLGVPYKAETLDAFEAGLKQELLDHRLRLDGSAFLYLYNNIQTVTYPNGSLAITNGAKAHLYGLDFDAEYALTSELKLSGAFEALHSEYTSFPDAPISEPVPVIAAGEPGYGGPGSGGTEYVTRVGGADGYQLPKAPKFTSSVAADYSRSLGFGKFLSNVTYSYDSGWFAESDNRLRQPSYGLLNAFVGFGDRADTLVVKLWGKNLTNKLYAGFLASQTNGDFVQWAPPRTYGVTVTRKF